MVNFSVGKAIYRILFAKRSNANVICRVFQNKGLLEIIPWVPVNNKKVWALRIFNKEKGEYAYLLFEHKGMNKPSMDDCLDVLRNSTELEWHSI